MRPKSVRLRLRAGKDHVVEARGKCDLQFVDAQKHNDLSAWDCADSAEPRHSLMPGGQGTFPSIVTSPPSTNQRGNEIIRLFDACPHAPPTTHSLLPG